MEKKVYKGSGLGDLRLVQENWYAYDDFRTEVNTIPMYYLIPGSTGPVQNSSNVLRIFKSRLERIVNFEYGYDKDVRKTINFSTTDHYFSLTDYLDYRDFLPLMTKEFSGREVHFKYPYHFSYGSSSSRVKNNFTSVLPDKTKIIEETFKDHSRKVIGGNLTDYKFFPDPSDVRKGAIRPTRIYALELDQPSTSFVETKFSATELLPTDPNYKLKYSDFIYDHFGNLVEMTDKGRRITYVYGYSGKYILAKLDNVSYQTVLEVLGESAISVLNSPTVSDLTINNTIRLLRSDSRTKSSLITSYTYKPLVGMTSMTDPNGLRTEYIYDNFNRLKETKDFEGNLLKNYQYNYKSN